MKLGGDDDDNYYYYCNKQVWFSLFRQENNGNSMGGEVREYKIYFVELCPGKYP